MFRTLVAKPAGIFARRGGSVSASMSGSSFKRILKEILTGETSSSLASMSTTIPSSPTTRWLLQVFFIKMLIVQRLHVSWSPPVQRGRLRGDLGDEMQPDLRRDSLPRQPGWLYSPPGVVFWKPIKNFQSLMDFIKKAISQGEKVVLAKCQKALIGGTDLLPTSALGRPRWAHVWHWIDDPYISYIIQHEFNSL